LFNAGSSCVISIIRSWRPGENRRLGLIGIEAARFRRLPLAQQNAEHVHRRAQQRLVVQRRAVACDDGRRVEAIDALERLQPLGRISAQRERDRLTIRSPSSSTFSLGIVLREAAQRRIGRW